jgi:hypothetical protein
MHQCLRVGAFLDHPPYQFRMLAKRGYHQRRHAILVGFVYVRTELFDEAS